MFAYDDPPLPHLLSSLGLLVGSIEALAIAWWCPIEPRWRL